MKPAWWIALMLAVSNPIVAVGLFIVLVAVLSVLQLVLWWVVVPALVVFLIYKLVKSVSAKRKLLVVHAPALGAARVEFPQPQLLLEQHKGPQKW